MAKLKAGPIGLVDIDEYLSTDSDFAFELDVLRMFREHGIDCEHGGLYEDPVTQKSREFDIRAARFTKKYRVRLAVECKNLRENFPALVLCVPRQPNESFHQIALVGDPKPSDGTFALPGVHRSRARALTIRHPHSIYDEGGAVGKSTAQVGRSLDGSITSNDSELYEKWGQALSSAHDLVSRSYWDNEGEEGVYCLSTVIPMVIVPDGRLWIAQYGADGVMTQGPSQVDRCSCFVDKQYEMGTKLARDWLTLSHMEVVTKSGAAQFIGHYLKDDAALERLFPPAGLAAALA